MKIINITLIALLATIAGYSQTPVFQWGATITSSDPGTHGTSAAHSIKTNAAGEIFILGVFGSSTAAQQTQDGNKIGRVHINYKHYTESGNQTFPDSPSGLYLASGLNTNDNLFIYKLDRDGNLLWQVTSDRGYINAAYSPIIPTPDGGALLILKVRPRAAYGDYDTGGDNLLRLIGSNGVKEKVEWNSNKVNAYQGVTVKISADGIIEYIKHNIQVEYTPIGEYPTTDAAIYFYDLAIDNEGNYYLGGRFARPITFNLPNNQTTTLTPHNAAGWDGLDSSRGDLLLAKLDPDGNLIWNIETTGTVKQQTVESITYNNNKLHIFGRIQADTINTNQSSSTILGHTITPGNKEDIFTARIDISSQTPQLDWLTHFIIKPQTNTKGGSALPLSLNHDNGTLLATGHFTGFIATGNNPSDNILSNDIKTGDTYAPQLGFILKQDAATGLLTGYAKDPIGGIGAHIRTAAFRQNHVHAYRTDLGSLWYESWDADFSNPQQHKLATIESATATQALFLNDRFIILGRGRHTPDVTGAPETFKENNPEAITAVILSFALDSLDEDNTGTYNIQSGDRTLTIRPIPGAISIEGTADVRIFNLNGALAYSGAVRNQTKEITLKTGIYIVIANGKATKVPVK
jgi:hypothetical protein